MSTESKLPPLDCYQFSMLTCFRSGRADWVWLDEKGKSTIYINQRGSDKSLIPHWVQAASSHGGGFTLKDGGSREDIQFGRLYGSGRADVSACPTRRVDFGITDDKFARIVHVH